MSKSDAQSILFTKRLRDATKSIHNASDSLVNIKLGLSLSDERVWAEGLLVFYEVFRFLDEAIIDLKDSLIGEFRLVQDLRRTEAFEEDLLFYYGAEWRGSSYVIRPSVGQYLSHLSHLKSENPYLLIAYIYHLYMGLLSGGQVLLGKRKLIGGGDSELAGNAVTHFGDVSISSLKKRVKETTNRIAEDLDEDTLRNIEAEGINVFKLNNDIIASVTGVNEIFYRKLLKLALFIIVCLCVIKFLF